VNKRPGQIKVTVESGFCSFCDRTRNLRREERQLGALVRVVTSCESCHRVLSSTIGVADADAGAAAESNSAPAAARPEPVTEAARPKRDPAPQSKEATAKPKTAAAKSKTPAKRSPRSK
jgi:hypothetical protein